MASPNRLDRNASSPNRLRRNMQRLVLGAATSTIALSSTGGIVNTSTGLAVNVDGSSIVINSSDKVALNIGSTGSTLIVTTANGVNLVSQASTLFLAGPSTGAAAAPTFRRIASTDIPTLPSSTITFPAQNSTTVFAGPSSGAAATPTFRPLASTDIPSLPSTLLPSDIAYTDKANIFTLAQQVNANIVISTGNLYLDNNKDLQGKDTGGTYRHIISIGGDNSLFFQSAGGGINMYSLGGTLLFGADDFGNRIYGNKEIAIPHFCGWSNAGNVTTLPTINAGTGAGTGPTLAIDGTDTAGQITITTGSAPAASALIATITFGLAYFSSTFVVFSPANANAAALSGTTSPYVTTSTSAFALRSNTAALAATTTYVWYYHTFGYA